MTSSRPPLFLVTSDEEKTATKKSPSREVLLIRDVIPRFSDHIHLRPSTKNAEKKKPSHRLAVRGHHRSWFSLFFSFFLFLLPCFFSLFVSLFLTATKLILPGGGWRVARVEIDRYQPVSSGNEAETTSSYDTRLRQ
ncbi:hypothetical protein GW17_00043823 [Ensete ventricosum]|nr:hypothetical protein GW17_00043823 [Ensete ventricosum]RZS24730.1 hypothetical protein BHM03_00057841 [Ensete ventricosum]